MKIAIENAIVELAKKYNLSKVILYGSRARGDNHERSDIDLAEFKNLKKILEENFIEGDEKLDAEK